MLLLLLTVGFTGWLTFQIGQQAVSELANQVMAQVGDRIEQKLAAYLKTPQLINAANADLIRLERLPGFATQEPQPLERYFWQQIQQFDAISSITIANEQGGMIGSGRLGDGQLVVYSTPDFVQGTYRTYATNGQGDRTRALFDVPNYNAQIRPWYRTPADAGKPTWSEIYPVVGGYSTLAISAGLPVKDAQGKIQGVLATDIALGELGNFLRQVAQGAETVFITEPDGSLVATSSIAPFTQKGNTVERIRATESQDLVIRQAYQQFTRQFKQPSALTQDTAFEFTFGHGAPAELRGQHYLVQVHAYHDAAGLDWQILVAIPESAFMAKINGLVHRTVGVYAIAIVTALLLGSAIFRWLAHPVQTLSHSAMALANGDLAQPNLKRTQIRELDQLAIAFNCMTDQVKESLNQVEAALKLSETRLSDILDSAIAFVFSVRVFADQTWAYEYCSAGSQFVVGYSPKELMADTTLWFRLIHPEDLENIALPGFKKVFSGESGTVEYRIRHKNDSTQWISLAYTSRREEAANCWVVTGVVTNVSDRKQAELENQKLRDKLESLLQQRTAELQLALVTAGMGIWEQDLQTQRQQWSPENYALFGFHLDADGRVFDWDGNEVNPEITTQVFLSRLHPEDVEKVAHAKEQALHRRSLYECEYRVLLPDGTTHWRFTRGSYTFDEQGQPLKLTGVNVDISPIKQAEADLRQSEQIFRRLFEDAPIGIVMSNPVTLKIERANQQFCELFGYTVEELSRLTFEDFTHPEDLTAEWPLVERMLRGESNYYRIEKRYVRKNGEVFWGDLTVTVLKNDAGVITQGFGMVQEISDRKQSELQTRENLKEKEVLLKEIHHRVKNNLQIIVSLLRMQSDRISAPEMLLLFREAQNRVQSMALIHELLYQSPDLARLEFGEYLRNLVGSLYRTCRVNANRVELILDTVDLALNLDIAIPCGLILNELVTNAFKYAFPDDRSGTVTVRLETLRHGPTLRGRLTVSDDGVGIPDSFNVQDSDSIGLVIVHSLVSQIRGTLTLDQAQGTTFHITFALDPR